MDDLSFLRERATEKALACDAFEEVLLVIEAEIREPDDWERVCLADALAALSRGAYRQARMLAEKALTPVYERSNVSRSSEFNSLSLSMLTRSFATVRAERLRASPHLGPIIFRPAA